jgi:hypothetical protein
VGRGRDDRLRAGGVHSLQALWISPALDRVHATLDRLDSKFDQVEGVVLRDHGERIALLEASHD